MARVSGKNKKRVIITFGIISVLILLLSFRLAWIQVVKAEEYSGMAIDQQTSDIPIEAKRGSILDRNGEKLATSAACYTVWARPSDVKKAYTTDKEIKEISGKLAMVLDMEAAEVEEKITKQQALIKIAKYLDTETADKIRELVRYGLELAAKAQRY